MNELLKGKENGVVGYSTWINKEEVVVVVVVTKNGVYSI